MYKIIAIISALIRCYLFPNPFEGYFRNVLENTILESSSSQIAAIFNLIFGGAIIGTISYGLVGIIYRRGESPILGSLLFLVSFFINTYILKFIFDAFVGYKILFIIASLIVLEYLITYTIKNKISTLISGV